MLTDSVAGQSLQLGFSDNKPRPSAELLQRLAWGDEAYINAAPNRYDSKYILGRQRKETEFTAEYISRKRELQRSLLSQQELQPLNLRAVAPEDIANEAVGWPLLFSGERPLIYRKIDSLFSPELHLFLDHSLIGVRWFADSNSDGCYHLVLFRKDYAEGRAMARQLVSLVQLRDSPEGAERQELNMAIFMLRYTWDHPLTEAQLTPPGGRFPEESITSVKRRKVCEALQGWLDLGELRSDYYPILSYARKQKIAESSFQIYARCSGLRRSGKRFMQVYWAHLAQNILTAVPCSMQQALQQWRDLSIDQRRAWTIKHFAHSRNIPQSLFEKYVSVAKGLQYKGMRRLYNLQKHSQIPEAEHGALIHTAVFCWLRMSRIQRDKLTLTSYAVLSGADFDLLNKYTCSSGLTERGQRYFQHGQLTLEMLRLWDSFTDEQRQSLTMGKYAESNRISLDYWQKYATPTGLTAAGKAEMNTPDIDALLNRLREVFSSDEKMASLHQQGKALKRQLIEAAGNIQAAAAATLADPPQAAIITVKQEPDDNLAGEYCWVPPVRLHQKWDNAAPLLTSAADPQCSQTATLMSARPLQFTFSTPLNNLLKGLSRAAYQRFLRIAERFSAGVIKHDGKNQPARFERYIAPPVQQFVADVTEPQRQVPAAEGLRVVAACDIPPLTIIGAYSGVYLATAAEQSIEYALIGAERSLGKSWTAPGEKDGFASVVSGFRNGNILSLVNTNQLPGLPPLSESGEQGEEGNNLAVMFVNDLLPVYVAIKTIKRGHQLLISYDGLFNPLEIKQESYRSDTLSLVARRYRLSVIVEDADGELESGWNRAGEAVSSMNSEELTRPAIILRQRPPDEGYIWYDAINAQGEIIAHSPKHPYDNFWHALATGLFGLATAQNIDKLKGLVVGASGDEDAASVQLSSGAAVTPPDTQG